MKPALNWRQSGPQGRILHLIDADGLAQCGRRFDPRKTRKPAVSDNAVTLRYCQPCLQAALKDERR